MYKYNVSLDFITIIKPDSLYFILSERSSKSLEVDAKLNVADSRGRPRGPRLVARQNRNSQNRKISFRATQTFKEKEHSP